jgi:multidrug resistance efflux pump
MTGRGLRSIRRFVQDERGAIHLRLFVPAAILTLFIGGGWTLRNQLAADRQGDWVRVTRGDLVTGVEVMGTLASTEGGTFGPPQLDDVWDFKISMMAPEGSEITAGRPLLGFDTSELQKRLDQKSAEAESARKEIEKRGADLRLRREDERLKLAEAEASLRKASLKLEAPADIIGTTERKQVELDHALSLRQVADGKARIADLERAAAAEIGLLESKLKAASAVVNATHSAIVQMTILAPRNGTVVYSTNWRGEKKKVGDSCWRMERVMEIPDLNRMVAQGDVDEVDAGKAAVGQRVTFRLDARPDEEFHGTIRKAARTVQQAAGTKDPLKVLRVEIALDRADPAKMRPGMRFQGKIELGRIRDAVLVPRAAIFLSPRGPVAYRRGIFSVEAVPLRLGAQNEELVTVLSGLGAKDKVMVPKKDQGEKAKA